MTEKKDFFVRQVENLNRQYGKDELVASLNKQISDQSVEIGQLKSEVDHLSSLTDIEQEVKKGIHKEKLYNDQSTEIGQLRKNVKILNNDNIHLKARLNSRKF